MPRRFALGAPFGGVEGWGANDPADAEPPVANFTISRMSDQRIVEGLEAVPFVPGQEIAVAGVSFRIGGDPAPGDTFRLDATERRGILTTLGDPARTLREPVGDARRGDYQARLDASLTDLDSAQSSILSTSSVIGARLNTLESMHAMHEELDVASETVLSDLRDVDYAEAVSRLSLQSFILEAAQQSFARVANLTLFNAL